MLETIWIAKTKLKNEGHTVIDLKTDFLDKVFTSLCGLAFNGVEYDMEGEKVLPEYGVTENVGIIP